MLNDRVLLTYKRKRFSYQTDTGYATEAIGLSPNMQKGSPWISSPKSECHADDVKPKNLHSEKCQCSPSFSRYGFTDSIPATKEKMQITVQKDMGQMVLRSRRVLGCTHIENISRLVASSTGNASQNKMKDAIQVDASARKSGLNYITCGEGSLKAPVAVHDQTGNPINLNLNFGTDGGDTSECPEDGAKMSLQLDTNGNVLQNGGSLRENSVTQLITFSRRAKLKRNADERMTYKTLNAMEKLSFPSTCSSHVTGANFSYEGSSQKFIVGDQVNNSLKLLENCVVPHSQVEVANENVLEAADFMADDTSDCPSEVCNGSKIKKLKTILDFQTTMHSSEEPCKEFLAARPIDVVKDNIFPLNTAPSNSANNAFSSSMKESGRKLNICANNCEKRTLAFLTEERNSTAGLDLLVSPTSVCQLRVETNKSNYVPKNHEDSRTLGSSLVLSDEENDARNIEIEWLASLENVLRERKKNRGTCSLVVHDVKDHQEGLTPTMPNKSANQSAKVQDIAIDFGDQLSFPQKFPLAKFPYSSSVEQQKAEKFTPFTDFLSRSATSNLDLPLDLNAAESSSGSHFRDKLHFLDRRHPFSSIVNPPLLKHKKTTEKAIAEKLPSRKQDYFPDEPNRIFKEWSEEELDFLWIGMRRHGVDNWKAILGDPKLLFARSRFPEDLALQWEQEQKKLFNGILLPSPSLSKTNICSSQLLDACYAAKAHAYVLNPVSTAETKLSLGDAYLCNENTAKNTQFGADYPPMTSASSYLRPLQGIYSSMSSYTEAAKRHKKSSNAPRTTYPLEFGCDKQFWERPGNEQKPAGFPASTNLPHWLKEAYNSPRPSDMPWPAFFAAGTAPGSVHNDIGLANPAVIYCEPPAASKDLRGRGILKRKSVFSQKVACSSGLEEASASVDESAALCIKPSVGLILVQAPPSERPASSTGASQQKNITAPPENIPPPVLPDDLVVIDCDASSEETISDDQNMRSSYQDSEQID